MALMNYTTEDAKNTSTNEVDEVSTDDFCVRSTKCWCTPTSQVFSGSVSDNKNPTNCRNICNKSCLHYSLRTTLYR